MSQIIVNEVSNNFTYSIGNNSYASVALPLTSCWGPGFFDPETSISDEEATSLGDKIDLELENVVWQRFPANQDGIESFVSTYRGPSSNYRLSKDYSYYMALTLMTAGYDVLTCRLCPGTYATSEDLTIEDKDGNSITAATATLSLKAKYPGTFGNQLVCSLYKAVNRNYWNLVTYVVDATGVKTAVENVAFVFDPDDSNEKILHVDEVDSEFVQIVHTGDIKDDWAFKLSDDRDAKAGIVLTGGTDRASYDSTVTNEKILKDAKDLAVKRFYHMRDSDSVTTDDIEQFAYIKQLDSDATTVTDTTYAQNITYKEWLYNYVVYAYDLLKDRLAYNPNRIISPWDDVDITSIGGVYQGDPASPTVMDCISPIHLKLMEVAYYSRCATAYLDVPRCLPRKEVFNESTTHQGYAQMLANYQPDNTYFEVNGTLYATHSALFAPWAQYKYVGTNKYNPAPASFLTLLVQRSMVLNQSLQYEWIMPSSRKHNVKISKPMYKVPKKILDVWQPTDEQGGTGVNVVTDIPGMGITIWGNQTLFNTPPATYNALRQLSTRHLVCALKDAIYKAGLSITFAYNNSKAYSTFYAAVTPLLDTMVNAGAVESYYVTMNHDLDALGMVKANSVVGKVYLVPEGVIEKITVDLIALPPGTDLTPYQS